MPTDLSRYPADWYFFSKRIRFQRARSRCECIGECEQHLPNPSPRRCVEVHGRLARWFKGRVILTTAHLCTCNPPCAIESHVKAMCQRCHLRVDRFCHAQARLRTLARQRNARFSHQEPPEFLPSLTLEVPAKG